MMNRVTQFNRQRALALVPVTIIGLAAIINLGACSGGSTTDNSGGTGAGATGGTAPTTGGTTSAGGSGGATSAGGTAGKPSTGGSSGSSGAPSSGGSGGSGTGSGGSTTAAMQPVPTVAGCDFTKILPASCNVLGCHKGSFASAKLDLTPDMGLVGRLKDVVATHGDIPCPDNAAMTCMPTTCPAGVKLVDSANPQNSWMIDKLEGNVSMCGTIMPQPGSGYSLDATGKACLESLVTAIAALK